MSFKHSGYTNNEDFLASQRRHYHKHKEHYLSKQKEKRELRRQFILEQLGDTCSICGSKDDIEFDHINPALKTSRQSILSKGIVSIKEELPNMQPLCHSCHKRRSVAQKKAAWEVFCRLTKEEQDGIIEKYLKDQ